VLHAGDVVAQPVPGGALAVLLDSDATQGRLGVIEQTVAARNPCSPLHTHLDFDELFFVQDGTPEFRVADESIAAAPGSLVGETAGNTGRTVSAGAARRSRTRPMGGAT